MLTQEQDQQLVERVQRGDKRAFDLLVLKYQHKILGLIVRFVHDAQEAQDVAQEAFIKAYRALGNFRGDSAFYTWLYRIAINTAKNHLVGRLAVAASVTLAVLAGVRLYNQNDALPQMAQQGTTPQIALPQVKGPAVLAGYSEEQGAPQVITNSSSSDTRWHEQRLPIYLRQHVQQSAVSGTESALPYARAASLENR
ncbi:sigma-70 family RNA polymerase sigma factor [Pseudomonas aeruginosa]